MKYYTKMSITGFGMIMFVIGGGVFFISHGGLGGFYPSEASAERGNIGSIIGVIGFVIFLFGLIFPARLEPPTDNSSRSPLQ